LNAKQYRLILTNTYDKPGELLEARKCVYLQSGSLPSPMGMYLNPFSDSLSAIAMKEKHPGTVYTYDQLDKLIMTR
jgi:copper chaperone NosL